MRLKSKWNRSSSLVCATWVSKQFVTTTSVSQTKLIIQAKRDSIPSQPFCIWQYLLKVCSYPWTYFSWQCITTMSQWVLFIVFQRHKRPSSSIFLWRFANEIRCLCSFSHSFLKLQAYLQALNLSASSLYAPEVTSMEYLNYGAAVSEVSFSLSLSLLPHILLYGFYL